ncbi:MFS transporter [Actinoplanes sp. NPDC026670]|uniref:MFS transporter n=1 Tax=Actinoplanes sp. NPDC026670 TaxID=3154700 RepID=UPI0033D102C7
MTVVNTLPRRTGFVGISAALVAFFIAAGAVTPLLPLYEKSWGFPHSTLTLAFGVYAIALLAALLVAGSLSDHVGRRPVLVGALALELAAMLVFVTAPSIGWIIAGRVLQGIATGAASSAFGAAVVELAPERHKKLGALMTSLASTAGLGIGALLSGLVAQSVPAEAAFTVWLVLVIVMAAGTVFAVFTPETVTRRSGALASLTPRISVPARVRRQFAATAPGVASVFMTTALFLGLVPIVFAAVFAAGGPVVGGLAAFVLFGAGAVVSAATSGVRPRDLEVAGDLGLTAGSILFVGGIALGAFPLVWIAAILSGAGMGATFSGTIRGLVPQVEAHERAGLFTAVFVVAYLALGVSAIVAGPIATAVGVADMAIGFGVVLALVSALALVLSLRGRAFQQRGDRSWTGVAAGR